MKTKEGLEQVVNNNGDNDGKGIFQTDKNQLSIVLNAVPIGYIDCIMFGIGSWEQSFVYLMTLCLSYIIGKMMSVNTFNKMAKYSLGLSIAYLVVRAFHAGILAACEL